MYRSHTVLVITAIILAASCLSLMAIPAVVPVARNGVVLDSSTGQPLADVLITVRELADTVGNCIGTDTPATVTNTDGKYELKLGCAAVLTFAKPGYNTVALRWPQQIADGEDWGCCPDLRPIEIARSPRDSLPHWQQSFGYAPEEVYAIEIGDFGYPYVPVRLGGRVFMLAFDTGNMVGITVNSSFFNDTATTEIYTWNRLSGSGQVVATLRVGQTGNVSTLGVDLGLEEIYEIDHKELPGLVGPAIVDGGRFTLDYRSRLIGVSFDPQPGPVPGFHSVPLVPSSLHRNLILIRGTIEGRRILIELDTGKSRTVINPGLATTLGLEKSGRGVQIHDLQIGKLSFNIPSAKEVDQTGIETGSSDRILAGVGSDLLSQIVWTVDYKSGVIWLPNSR
jgi:hypothetical protein